MTSSEAVRHAAELICLSASERQLKKAVFSKPADTAVKRAEITPRKISGRDMLQLETYLADNKAIQRNIPADDTPAVEAVVSGFSQVNVITACGECEYRKSKSGNDTVIGYDKLKKSLGQTGGAILEPEANNREKNYILTGDEAFLKYLGVSGADGRVYDRKQSKFRQINRFLELIRDIVEYLPDDNLRICDLCCGKSYLSFAVYHYFAVIKKMKVSMSGVDLKPDVIEFCKETAAALGYGGLEFVCGDIREYKTDTLPQLVVSLHACDTATDVVLEKAAEWHAKVILSTPCCHHELNHTINCPELKFITDYSMLRQKLCDAATDAMRLKKLEAEGYMTAALELIDPEETPKNIMLRAIRLDKFDPESGRAKKLAEEYRNIREFLVRNV